MIDIRPITELRNTAAISELCHESGEPIFLTKNGYNDLVIMSHEVYEELFGTGMLLKKLAHSRKQIANGEYVDGDEFLEKMREKYGWKP